MALFPRGLSCFIILSVALQAIHGDEFTGDIGQRPRTRDQWLRVPFQRRTSHRYGHSFVGKRSDIGEGLFSDTEGLEPYQDEEFPDIERRAAAFAHAFVGKREPEMNTDSNLDTGEKYGTGFDGFGGDDEIYRLGKRFEPRTVNTLPWKRLPIEFFPRRAPSYSHSFVGKRSGLDNDASDFSTYDDIAKRAGYTHSFVGKRHYFGPGQPFLYVRDIESRSAPNFVHRFVGKRSAHNIVKRAAASAYGHAFVGKRDEIEGSNNVEGDQRAVRSYGHAFVGKRAARYGHSFVGKRARYGHSFVGKRTPGYYHGFVGKRDFDDADASLEGSDVFNKFNYPIGKEIDGLSPEILQDFGGVADVLEDKRSPRYGHAFVGKREDLEEDKRSPRYGHAFVGKREDSEEDKRSPRYGHAFVGKREDSEEDKRSPRYGHAFVGKREDSEEDKRSPRYGHAFVGKREDSEEDKRSPRYGHAFVGKREDSEEDKRSPRYGHAFVGKREDLEEDKRGRYGHAFVGKRDVNHIPTFAAFLGNQDPEIMDAIIEDKENLDKKSYGHAFVGKRVPRYGHAFVGKRGFGHAFVGKRQPGYAHAFVGKRSDSFDDDESYNEPVDSTVLGSSKRGFGHAFVGKRGYGHAFVGKRGYGHAFVGKRGYGHAFVGKRGFGHAFVGKRDYGHAFVGKRGFGHAFVGKRGYGHAFVGKRGFGHAFVGKRGYGHAFVGKRGYGHAFVGKRGYGHAFVGKRDNSFNDKTGSGSAQSFLDFLKAETNAAANSTGDLQGSLDVLASESVPGGDGQLQELLVSNLASVEQSPQLLAIQDSEPNPSELVNKEVAYSSSSKT